MAFTNWTDFRTLVKDAMVACLAGKPFIKSYTLDNGMTLTARDYKELTDLLAKSFELEAIESAGSVASMVSYGRPRRFR